MKADYARKVCEQAVFAAAREVRKPKYSSNSSAKADKYVGHHAILTEGDTASQDIILGKILKAFPNAYFIAEEKGTKHHDRILNSSNYLEKLEGLVFGVDSIDGSSMFRNKLYEWAIPVGGMENRKYIAGAIACPEIGRGQILSYARGKGVLLNGKRVKASTNTKMKDWVAISGPDFTFMPEFNSFINAVGRSTRTVKGSGSCAIALALVASGRADVAINPTQRVWDWFAGASAVEEAGGKVQFYRVQKEIIPVNSPEPEDFNPDSKNLGFVAGNKHAVKAVFEMLLENFGK